MKRRFTGAANSNGGIKVNGNSIKLPDEVKAGDRFEVQLAPLGAYPQIVNGEKVVQVVDEEAAQQIVKNFTEDVLVDRDHDSEEGRGTEAQAWVKNVRVDPERGIVGTFEFTDKGAEAVKNRRFRFVSPAWTLDKDNRPNALVSVALTNKPNLPVAPVLNMKACCGAENECAKNADADANNNQPEKPTGTESAETRNAETQNNNPVVETPGEKKGNPNMDKIKAKLGLPPETSDEDVEAAIDALIQALGKANDSVKNMEAEKFAEENADVVENAEELKEQFKADPEGTAKVVANCRRMMEKAVANAKAAGANEAKRIAINAVKPNVADPSKAVEPEIATHRVALNSCKSIEEQNAYILAHRGEMG